MQKKFLFSFILILFILSVFTISSYAATEYSVYDESKGNYRLNINFKEKTHLNIEDINIAHTSFTTPDLYFLISEKTLEQNATYSHYLYVSTSPFVCTQISNTSFYLETQDGNIPRTYRLKRSGGWSFWDSGSSTTRTILRSELVFSSDDLKYNDETIIYKYVKSPLVRNLRGVNIKSGVTKEIVLILPVVLTIIIGLIGIRKAIAFVRRRARNA